MGSPFNVPYFRDSPHLMFNFYGQSPIISILNFLHLNFFLSLVSKGILIAPQRKHNGLSYCILTNFFGVEATLYRFFVAVVMVFSDKEEIARLNPSVSSSPCQTKHNILYLLAALHISNYANIHYTKNRWQSMQWPTTEIFKTVFLPPQVLNATKHSLFHSEWHKL